MGKGLGHIKFSLTTKYFNTIMAGYYSLTVLFKYMNGSFFLKSKYMNGVGFQILA